MKRDDLFSTAYCDPCFRVRLHSLRFYLPISRDSLVHVYPRDDNNLGVIGESKKSEISSKFMRCDIDSCKNLGNGGHPPRKSVPGASKDLDERCRLVDAEKEDFAPDDTDLLVVTNVEQAKQRAGSNQGDIQDYFTDDSVVASSSPPPRVYSSPPPRAYSSPSPRAYSSPPPRAYSSPPSPPYSRTPPSY
ncbi:unnamed protein product [Bemisia tabaci]|uniref:Uncharacterized protein n=1 Tax=Bemisia tabaci TaxID=7038 RepID=A0A9P0AL34_BEMTA|nr:unnamed protein product [Bemisia tabaci]